MSLQSAASARSGFAPPLTVSGTPWTAAPAPGGPPAAGLALTGPVLHVLADSAIYAEGDEARLFYKVVSGVVRTCRFLNDGRRQIEAFHVAGDVFGLDVAAARRLSAEAVSDCTLIGYRRHGLETLAAADTALAGQLLSYALRCVERAQDHAMLLGRSSAAQKVAIFLLEMADRMPIGETIDLAMTRQDIADYLGLTIETVSRTLSQFERDALIARPSARRIRLNNRAALRALGA
jgi:CRP/FNR family nitrogen fixation transcriptional regulator